jgi:hypothetical protein
VFARSIAKARAELLVAAAVIVGWAAITSGVAQIVRPDVVWRVSAGSLFLSLCGWRLLGRVASHGLYTLSRDKH